MVNKYQIILICSGLIACLFLGYCIGFNSNHSENPELSDTHIIIREPNESGYFINNFSTVSEFKGYSNTNVDYIKYNDGKVVVLFYDMYGTGRPYNLSDDYLSGDTRDYIGIL